MNEAVNNSEQLPADAGSEQETVARLQKKLGDQANEIGSLRSALEVRIDEQDAALISESFDEDQIKAVERMVDKKLQPVTQAVHNTAVDADEQKLLSKHSDYREVIDSPEFITWMDESRIRSTAYQSAVAGDIDTGIELLDQYKATNPTQPQEAAMATALTSSRGSSGDSGIREGGVLSRQEIQHLKMTDKPKYRAMLPEIMKAYAEGRVR